MADTKREKRKLLPLCTRDAGPGLHAGTRKALVLAATMTLGFAALPQSALAVTAPDGNQVTNIYGADLLQMENQNANNITKKAPANSAYAIDAPGSAAAAGQEGSQAATGQEKTVTLAQNSQKAQVNRSTNYLYYPEHSSPSEAYYPDYIHLSSWVQIPKMVVHAPHPIVVQKGGFQRIIEHPTHPSDPVQNTVALPLGSAKHNVWGSKAPSHGEMLAQQQGSDNILSGVRAARNSAYFRNAPVGPQYERDQYRMAPYGSHASAPQGSVQGMTPTPVTAGQIPVAPVAGTATGTAPAAIQKGAPKATTSYYVQAAMRTGSGVYGRGAADRVSASGLPAGYGSRKPVVVEKYGTLNHTPPMQGLSRTLPLTRPVDRSVQGASLNSNAYYGRGQTGYATRGVSQATSAYGYQMPQGTVPYYGNSSGSQSGGYYTSGVQSGYATTTYPSYR